MLRGYSANMAVLSSTEFAGDTLAGPAGARDQQMTPGETGEMYIRGAPVSTSEKCQAGFSASSSRILTSTLAQKDTVTKYEHVDVN